MNHSSCDTYGHCSLPRKPEKVQTTGVPEVSAAHYLGSTPKLKYSTGDLPSYTLPIFS